MEYCIDHLLAACKKEDADTENRDTSVEQLCKLLETAGKKLEYKYKKRASEKGGEIYGAKWEEYFKKLQTISSRKGISSRSKLCILDLIDLRKHGW